MELLGTLPLAAVAVDLAVRGADGAPDVATGARRQWRGEGRHFLVGLALKGQEEAKGQS